MKEKADLQTPYISSEDSVLFREALQKYRGGRCLELGCGNASNAKDLASRFDNVVGTDILWPDRVKERVGAKVEVVIADRATCFRASVFDLVAFNPPYVPSETIEDVTVDGGKGGMEVPLMFLEEALRVVKKREGKVVLVLSSDDDLSYFERYCQRKGIVPRVVAKKRLFYETVYVYELRNVRAGI